MDTDEAEAASTRSAPKSRASCSSLPRPFCSVTIAVCSWRRGATRRPSSSLAVVLRGPARDRPGRSRGTAAASTGSMRSSSSGRTTRRPCLRTAARSLRSRNLRSVRCAKGVRHSNRPPHRHRRRRCGENRTLPVLDRSLLRSLSRGGTRRRSGTLPRSACRTEKWKETIRFNDSRVWGGDAT